MKQILQNIKDGRLSVADCPAPLVRPGHLLIRNAASLISAGTEKMVMDLAGKSLLGKARERPDHVRRVLEKVRNEGLLNTVRAVREKLDEPMTMGYSSAGFVLAAGDGVEEFKPGDRVASNGSHAEIVSVPRNLCARVPDGVEHEHAAFAVLGAIALQGIRLAKINLGETVLVIGLGLVGQIAVGLLTAAGCRVVGTDPDVNKCRLAETMGAALTGPGLGAGAVMEFSHDVGADAVVITASTKSNGPIQLAADAVRKRGRVVLVGVVGLELDRRPFYFKEAEFVVSCSYGPGRYDPNYEDRGHDYPAGYVRWTEQRNIESVLQAMAGGRLNVEPLISHRYPIEEGQKAYELIKESSEPYLGVLLTYPAAEAAQDPVVRFRERVESERVGVGVLGAGNFARMVLIPRIVAEPRFDPLVLCSAGGVSAAHSGQKHGFARATTDEAHVFESSDVDVVFSITQHHLHAGHVESAIRHGKDVFVEKPLCLSMSELARIEEALRECSDPPVLMVGFNRRFAPLAEQMKSVFSGTSRPLTLSFRFNAGAIAADHWTQDAKTGGGRIIGEACHAIDFAIWLTGSLPVRVYAEAIGGAAAPTVRDDQCFLTIRHENGSVSNIAYLAGGDKSCPKERVEVFGDGRTAILDDFGQLTVYQNGRKSVKKSRQNKGHENEITAFAKAVSGNGPAPIPWAELRATTLTSLLAVRSLREGMPFPVIADESAS